MDFPWISTGFPTGFWDSSSLPKVPGRPNRPPHLHEAGHGVLGDGTERHQGGLPLRHLEGQPFRCQWGEPIFEPLEKLEVLSPFFSGS